MLPCRCYLQCELFPHSDGFISLFSSFLSSFWRGFRWLNSLHSISMVGHLYQLWLLLYPRRGFRWPSIQAVLGRDTLENCFHSVSKCQTSLWHAWRNASQRPRSFNQPHKVNVRVSLISCNRNAKKRMNFPNRIGRHAL